MAADVSLIMSSRYALPYGTALAAEQYGSFRVFPVGSPHPTGPDVLEFGTVSELPTASEV